MGLKDVWSESDYELLYDLVKSGITDGEELLTRFNAGASATRPPGALIVKIRAFPPNTVNADLKRSLGQLVRSSSLVHEPGAEWIYSIEAQRLTGRNHAWLRNRVLDGSVRKRKIPGPNGRKPLIEYHRGDVLDAHRTVRRAPRKRPAHAIPLLPEGYLQASHKLPDAVLEGRGVRAEVVKLTPKDAEELLGKNRRNRNLSEPRMAAYVEELLAGHWPVNGETIILGKDGELYNGQHRMMALARAGEVNPSIVMYTLLVRGVAEEARPTIDKVKVRTVSDDWHMEGQSDSRRRVALVNSIVRLLQNRNGPSTVVANAIYEFYKEGIDWAVENVTGKASTAVIGGALAYAYRKDPEKVHGFNSTIQTRVDMTLDSPAYLLDHYLTSTLYKNDNLRTRGLKVLRMCQAHIEGQTVRAVNATQTVLSYFASAYDMSPVKADEGGEEEASQPSEEAPEKAA